MGGSEVHFRHNRQISVKLWLKKMNGDYVGATLKDIFFTLLCGCRLDGFV